MAEEIVSLAPPRGGLYSNENIISTIRENKHDLAGALLPAVVFNTSQQLDMGKVNAEFVACLGLKFIVNESLARAGVLLAHLVRNSLESNLKQHRRTWELDGL